MRLFSRRKGERFLLIDVTPTGAHGAMLAVDEDRHISPVKIWDELPARRLSRILPSRVALALHHSLLFTKEIPLELERDPELRKLPLDSLELENVAAQVIGKSFQEYRREASAFLGVDEFEATLVNNVLNNFLVDGKAVEVLGAPRAKKIKAMLQLQFTPRHLFEMLKDAWNAPSGFSLLEREEGKLHGLRKKDPRVDALLVLEENRQGNVSATLFSVSPRTLGRIQRKPLAWSRNDIDRRISEQIGADLPVAQAMYGMYRAGDMSPWALRVVKTIITPALQELQKEVAHTTHARRLIVTPAGELPRDFRAHATDFEVAARELAEQFGFSLDTSEWDIPPEELFGYTASFLEHYYDKSDHALNQRLQRRIHWLAPTPNE